MNQALITSYLHAEYNAAGIRIKPGFYHPELDAWIKVRQQECWAFITAFNPGSVLLDEQQNAQRNQHLLAMVQDYTVLQGYGTGPQWPQEESFLIAGIEIAKAIEIALHFEQLAFLWGKIGQKAHLIFPAAPMLIIPPAEL